MKTKEEIAEIILDQFRKSNSKAGQIVMINVFRHAVIPKLNPKEKELFPEAAEMLIEQDYMTYESDNPQCFRLTKKGYDSIYEDNFSLQPRRVIETESEDSIREALKNNFESGTDNRIEEQPVHDKKTHKETKWVKWLTIPLVILTALLVWKEFISKPLNENGEEKGNKNDSTFVEKPKKDEPKKDSIGKAAILPQAKAEPDKTPEQTNTENEEKIKKENEQKVKDGYFKKLRNK